MKLGQTEPHLTRGQNIVSLQDACRCEVVDDVLETNVFEHWTKRFALLCDQEGLFLTQVCGMKSIGNNVKHLCVAANEKDCIWRSLFHKMWPYCTCPAFAKPGIGVSQKLLDWAVPWRIDLQKHPLQREEMTKRALRNRSDATASVSGSCKAKRLHVPFSEQCIHPSPPAWQTGLRTGWAAPSYLPCECRAETNGEYDQRQYFHTMVRNII